MTDQVETKPVDFLQHQANLIQLAAGYMQAFGEPSALLKKIIDDNFTAQVAAQTAPTPAE